MARNSSVPNGGRGKERGEEKVVRGRDQADIVLVLVESASELGAAPGSAGRATEVPAETERPELPDPKHIESCLQKTTQTSTNQTPSKQDAQRLGVPYHAESTLSSAQVLKMRSIDCEHTH